MARLSVKLRKEIVRSRGPGGVAKIPTWITVCSFCGDISRNWDHGSAKDVVKYHRERHRLNPSRRPGR